MLKQDYDFFLATLLVKLKRGSQERYALKMVRAVNEIHFKLITKALHSVSCHT